MHPTRILSIASLLGSLTACGTIKGDGIAGHDSAVAAGESTPGDSSGDGHHDSRHTDTAIPPSNDLVFAVVGDTRPPNEDDTSHYPTSIIDTIWTDVEAESPHPQFALTTGDYMYANPDNSEQQAQLDKYMAARATFSGPMYPAMGNHECTGWTDSNCGTGNADGVTKNYTVFIDTMLSPIGETLPYYEEKFEASDHSWTAKLVVVAANAWSTAQSTWLSSALSEPTTYTFVMRHEDNYADTAPGVTPSSAIIAAHPLTLQICGHSHEYAHYSSDQQIIVGNGGAPLTGSTNYGYAVISRKSDGTISVKAYDYQTHASMDSFSIKADGSPA